MAYMKNEIDMDAHAALLELIEDTDDALGYYDDNGNRASYCQDWIDLKKLIKELL